MSKPKSIIVALKLLSDMDIKSRDTLQKILPSLAIQLENNGKKVTPKLLQSYIDKGEEHIKGRLQQLKKPKQRDLSFLEMHKNIKKAPPVKVTKDNTDLSPREILYKAAENGDLDIIKDLKEQGINIPKTGNKYLQIAAGNNHLNIVEYIIGNDINISVAINLALQPAAENGHLDIIKALVKHGADISTYALRTASKNGHFDIVKYAIENSINSSINKDFALHLAAKNGHLDIVKYLVEHEANVSSNNDYALEAAAKNDHTDIVKYLVEHGANIFAKNDAAIMAASSQRHFNVIRYLVETVADGKKYNPHGLFKAIFLNMDKWKKIHGLCPVGLEELSPYYFKKDLFNVFLEALKSEGYTGHTASSYAYHASALLGNNERSVSYFKKWAKKSKQPLHDIIQNIEVPNKKGLDLKSWGDALLKHGPKMARLIKFSDKLPQPLKNADGTWAYLKTRDELAKHAYKRGHIAPDIAALSMKYLWAERNFDLALARIMNYKDKVSQIPEITIDGHKFNKEGYEFSKLPDGDIKGLFLGEMTDCCQHLASAGEPCASYGYLADDSGFYVIKDKKTDKIVAQTWAWRGKNDELVFDSLENLDGHMNIEQWTKLSRNIGQKLNENKSDITALNIGTDGATPSLSFNKASTPAKPRSYKKYRDSKKQYQVWKS